jgi:hypothetical protein
MWDRAVGLAGLLGGGIAKAANPSRSHTRRAVSASYEMTPFNREIELPETEMAPAAENC